MFATVLLCSLAVSAEVTPEQRELLKLFRDEFISVTPGTGGAVSPFDENAGETRVFFKDDWFSAGELKIGLTKRRRLLREYAGL